MAQTDDQLRLLEERAARAFRASPLEKVVDSRRAIIGPRADLLISEAAEARKLLINGQMPLPRQMAALEKAIRIQRPAPACQANALTPLPLEGNWLAESWERFQPTLKSIQVSVGRLERIDDPEPVFGSGRTAVGTGFLVAENMLLTASHVVDALSFGTGRLERGQAVTDFRGYLGSGGAELAHVINVAALDRALDLALLTIDPLDSKETSRPLLVLGDRMSPVGTVVCVVGYPLEDPRNLATLAAIIFANNFGVKRAAVGEIVSVQGTAFHHDCSTLGGVSGSPIFDLTTGQVCGIHVSGSFMLSNDAIVGSHVRNFVTKSLKPALSILENRGGHSVKRANPYFDKYFEDLQKADPAVGAEMDDKLAKVESVESDSGLATPFNREAIVLTTGRPVLDIKDGETVLEIAEVESRIWKDRLFDAKAKLAPNIAAVGRIELQNHPRGAEYVGTGWIIRDNIVVTNRHVAEVFAQSDGEGFVFKSGFDGNSIGASIDFLEEFENDGSLSFPLFRIIHIESQGGPDLAFLRIEPVNGQALPTAVVPSGVEASEGEKIAVIGYPARDPFFPDPALMDRLFNNRYDKKRLAPGMVIGKSSERIFHDATTLGGNSGAAVVSLDSGKAVALHFAGTSFAKNHAVPIEMVASRLDQVMRPISRRRPEVSSDDHQSAPTKHSGALATPQFVALTNVAARTAEVTIPVKISVEVGDVTVHTATVAVSPMGKPPRISLRQDADLPDDNMVEQAEARPEDYRDREGYDLNFLGSGFEVPLPELTRNREDILTFDFDGQSYDLLRYLHFSVQMSKSRRMCRFSACNVDGKNSKRTTRTGWRTDPRIPKGAQILKECYGNAPKFSRGHMTRREDPAWGSQSVAQAGNADSMHVSNVVPQVQIFNAGIWLDLEDYALQNAREDTMRICVFTGPFLDTNDPVLFKIKVPTSFWKVIAFIHDETGNLCATGYTMSQKTFIGEEEFVFGRHENNQRPIAEIEKHAGISFGSLADVDPMKDLDESIVEPLRHPSQIRFV